MGMLIVVFPQSGGEKRPAHARGLSVPRMGLRMEAIGSNRPAGGKPVCYPPKKREPMLGSTDQTAIGKRLTGTEE